MPDHEHSTSDVPSPWVQRWANRILPAGRVLDVACGQGRHARWLAALGHQVTAVDRNQEALRMLTGVDNVTTLEADLENGKWPFGGEHFDAIVVVNYLHRPLLPSLLSAIARRGVLIYETFAAGNERYGRPRNPDFLLKPGELLQLAHGRLEVFAYENLTIDAPRPAVVQRICAVNAVVVR